MTDRQLESSDRIYTKLEDKSNNGISGHTPKPLEVVAEHGDNTDMVDDLLQFDNGMFNVSAKIFLVEALTIVGVSLSVVPSLLGRVLIDSSALILFNYIGDFDTQSLFGTYDAYFVLLYFYLVVPLIDKFGISISVAYGEHDYIKVKDIFTKSGLVCLIIIVFITIPLFLFAGSILRSIGFDSVLSMKVEELTRLSIPLLTINFACEYIKSICMSQGHEKIFGYSSAAFAIITIIANYFMIIHWHMGIKGWILTRTCYEAASLIVAVIVYYRITPETRGFVPLRTALKGFGAFLLSSILFMLTLYPDNIGFQSILYFIVLQRDIEQMAAYNIFLNFAGIIFLIGIAFSIICRTRINILIGRRKYEAAKQYYAFTVLVSIFTGVLTGLLTYAIRYQLASIFASTTEAMNDWYIRLIVVYAVANFVQTSQNVIMVGMKTIGKVTLLLIINIVIAMGGSMILGYLIYRLHGNCDLLFGNFMLICAIVSIVCMVITMRSNWSQIE